MEQNKLSLCWLVGGSLTKWSTKALYTGVTQVQIPTVEKSFQSKEGSNRAKEGNKVQTGKGEKSKNVSFIAKPFEEDRTLVVRCEIFSSKAYPVK